VRVPLSLLFSPFLFSRLTDFFFCVVHSYFSRSALLCVHSFLLLRVGSRKTVGESENKANPSSFWLTKCWAPLQRRIEQKEEQQRRNLWENRNFFWRSRPSSHECMGRGDVLCLRSTTDRILMLNSLEFLLILFTFAFISLQVPMIAMQAFKVRLWNFFLSAFFVLSALFSDIS
jgi:hypothetical protein